MSGMSRGPKFTGTTQSHTHPETPKVWYGTSPPTEGMKRGDLWVQTETDTTLQVLSSTRSQ